MKSAVLFLAYFCEIEISIIASNDFIQLALGGNINEDASGIDSHYGADFHIVLRVQKYTQ
jgi:hypothetical protein